ncbi:MAG: DNA-binding protein [Halobacteria archaeon]|nr:DNA-binding protein [Halobacteria archaeon]
MTDDELEKIREQKRKQLEDQQSQQEAQQEAQQRAEAQKKAILRQTLEPEARERLNAIRMAKPDFAEQVERQLVALAQSGRVQGKIDEEQMKGILKKLQPDDDDINIRRR